MKCQPDDIRLIPLTQGLFATVNLIDWIWLSQWKWHAVKNYHAFYAARGQRTKEGVKHILMHREVLGLSFGDKRQVDHKDGNGLNNTRQNIRIATSSQNRCNQSKQVSNTSGYKGVCYFKPRNKWCAQIDINGKRIHLGRFATKEEAFKVYCDAAKDLHGEFAKII